MVDDFVSGLRQILESYMSSPIPESLWIQASISIGAFVFFHPIVLTIIFAEVCLLALEVFITYVTMGAGEVFKQVLKDKIVHIILSLILSVLTMAGSLVAQQGLEASEFSEVLSTLGWLGWAAGFGLTLWLCWKQRHSLKGVAKEAAGEIVGAGLALAGLFLVLVSLGGGHSGLALDTIGIGLGFLGFLTSLRGKAKSVSIIAKAADAIAKIALAFDFATIITTDYDV